MLVAITSRQSTFSNLAPTSEEIMSENVYWLFLAGLLGSGSGFSVSSGIHPFLPESSEEQAMSETPRAKVTMAFSEVFQIECVRISL